MNYIGIDPSITSTGMIINGKAFNYSYNSAGYTKKGDYTKWYEMAKNVVEFRFHDKASFKNYQDEQVVKLDLYRSVIENIVDDIENNITEGEDIKVAIEGYSYSSSAGNLIDLVLFGSLVRDRLMEMGCEITVLPPTTLKLESCKMTYPPIEVMEGKRKPKIVLYHKNNDGISGGNFTKKEMYISVVENTEWKDGWKKHLENIRGDINTQKIPKPHEDITDAYLLYQYIKTLK